LPPGNVQNLDVGVHRDELNPRQAGVNHAVDGISAAAAAADHFDFGEGRQIVSYSECHV